MNAHERLHAAYVGALEGRYAEALSEYVWFHRHALAEQPSLYGVRLSFALSHWKELADVYPPALVALREIRESKTQRLFAGEFDRDLFHDVEAINRYLGARSETAQLFESLERVNPEFAQACGNLALEALVEAGKFQLAAKYIPDPIDRVATLAQRLNRDIARIPERPRSKSPRYRACICNFVLDLRTITAILFGADQHTAAGECRAKAFSILKPWYVRKAIERALASGCEGSK